MPGVFLGLSRGFPRGFPWFSWGFPGFWGFSRGFPGFFPRFAQGCPVVFRGFPWVFQAFFRGFPGVFPGFSQGFPGVFLGFSRGFPRAITQPQFFFLFYCLFFEINHATSQKFYCPTIRIGREILFSRMRDFFYIGADYLETPMSVARLFCNLNSKSVLGSPSVHANMPDQDKKPCRPQHLLHSAFTTRREEVDLWQKDPVVYSFIYANINLHNPKVPESQPKFYFSCP